MEKLEYFNCFLCGNLLTVGMIETIILGLVGGFVAMLSKDIYQWIKNLLKRLK